MVDSSPFLRHLLGRVAPAAFVAGLLASVCLAAPAGRVRDPAEAAIRRAIAEYRQHTDVDDWQARVQIDQRLLKEAGGVPAQRLEAILRAAPDDLETGTAVAVLLAQESLDDVPQTVAQLVKELLASRFERVRYRTAVSMTGRTRRGGIGKEMAAELVAAFEEARDAETSPFVANALNHTARTLKQKAEEAAR